MYNIYIDLGVKRQRVGGIVMNIRHTRVYTPANRKYFQVSTQY